MSYRGGIRTRLDEVWDGPILGPDDQPMSLPELGTMRSRARRLERDNPLAAGLLDRAVENVIGTGIKVRPMSGAPEWDAEVGELWERWTEGKYADIRRMMSWGQLQRAAYRAVLRDGDCGFVLVDRGVDAGAWPELQFIGGEHIESPGASTAGSVVDGIEFSAVNSPAAFHIRAAAANRYGRRHERVAARDFVYLSWSHVVDTARGVPRFHGTYELFDQLAGHIDAVVVAARVAASQAMIAKKRDGGRASIASSIARRDLTPDGLGRPVPARPIEPGMINYIGVDEDLTGFNPTQPHQNFEQFVRTISRLLGLKFGLTVERVLLDFSQANYSVSRSTALQEQRAAEPEQEAFNASFLARVYPWFVGKMEKAGRIKATPPTDGRQKVRYEWIPQARPLVEASKDAAGWRAQCELGVTSPEIICTEQGWDFAKIAESIRKSREVFADLGLAYPGDAAPAAPFSNEPINE